MLGELPSEVLAAIATHLIMDTGGPPVDLICTCRGACLALSPSTNEGLYAGVFRQLYDTSAVERRLYALETAAPQVAGKGKGRAGDAPPKQVSAVPSIASLQVALEKPKAAFMSAASSAAMTRENSRGLGASAKMLTAELRNRFLAFRKLREGRVDEQAMWVVYLMLIENGECLRERSSNRLHAEAAVWPSLGDGACHGDWRGWEGTVDWGQGAGRAPTGI